MACLPVVGLVSDTSARARSGSRDLHIGQVGCTRLDPDKAFWTSDTVNTVGILDSRHGISGPCIRRSIVKQKESRLIAKWE